MPELKGKTRKVTIMRRGGPTSDERVDDAESLLPPNLRGRLYELFGQIEREFEQLYAENLALHEKIEVLNERLDAATGGAEKAETNDSNEAMTAMKNFKKSGSEISKRLRLTYKTSTSRLMTSLKPTSSSFQLVRDFRGHRDGVWEVATNHAEPALIVTSSADHTAQVWSAQSGCCLLQYLGHSGSVNSARFHPTQDLVLSSSGDQTAHVWRAQISQQRYDHVKHSSDEDALDGSDDADGLESSDDRNEPVLHVRAPLRELSGHAGVVIAADWLSGGKMSVTASWDRNGRLFDTETGDCINMLTGHDQELTNVCAHASQQLAVTSSKDTTFRLWDFREPAMKVNVFQGHTQQVTSAVFASGGDFIVSGSDDRSARIWDLKNMRSPIATIRTDSAINRLSVAPTQNIIAMPHDNRHIRLYDLQGVRVGRLPRTNRVGHSRMVCATAWTARDDSACNLFSCGFDRHVFGWKIHPQMKD